MNDYIDRGHCRPSGFGEYDNLSGQVAHQSTVRGVTDDGWVVERTVTYISLGRPDRGTPVDPDAVLNAPEAPVARKTYTLSPERRAHVEQARWEAREKATEADARVTAHLRAHGPTSMRALVKALGYPHAWLVKHMTERKGTHYQYRARGPRGTLWDLAEGGGADAE